jgi:hypothetical protein
MAASTTTAMAQIFQGSGRKIAGRAIGGRMARPGGILQLQDPSRDPFTNTLTVNSTNFREQLTLPKRRGDAARRAYEFGIGQRRISSVSDHKLADPYCKRLIYKRI